MDLDYQLPALLLVDDSENDLLLVKNAFTRGKLRHPLRSVTSGTQAIEYVEGRGQFSDSARYPLPSLIILDIKMPPPDGFEVLRWIRQRPEFDKVCAVMLTASDEISDANRAYQLGADSFFVKPLDFNAAELSQSLNRMIKHC